MSDITMLDDNEEDLEDDELEEDEEYPEELYPVLELSDALFELIEKLEKVSKKLDNYEQEYLEADTEVRQSFDLPNREIFEHWDEFVSRAIAELDNLGEPI
jgi:DNA polymerase II large subunit